LLSIVVITRSKAVVKAFASLASIITHSRCCPPLSRGNVNRYIFYNSHRKPGEGRANARNGICRPLSKDPSRCNVVTRQYRPLVTPLPAPKLCYEGARNVPRHRCTEFFLFTLDGRDEESGKVTALAQI